MRHPDLDHLAALCTAALAAVFAALLLAAAPAPAATLPEASTALLSGAPSLFEPLAVPVGGADLTTNAVSQDGRFVVFSSTSDGLVEGDDDAVVNIYRKDMMTSEVVLVSRRDGADGEPSHSRCFGAAISDDGARVAFACEGPLDPVDANNRSDVYVRTPDAGSTVLASRRSNLGPVSNGDSAIPALSEDGSFVAFVSTSTDLAPILGGGGIHVYRRQLGGGDETILVSREESGNQTQGREPSISDDGSRIAFTAPGDASSVDTNDRNDVYVRDVAASKTILVSRKSGATGAVGNGDSYYPAIAGNGTAVAFVSEANQFDPDDTDAKSDIYWRGLGSNTTTLVDITIGGVKATSAYGPSLDDRGEVVGFVSTAVQLDPDDQDATSDAYVANLATNDLHLVSRADGATGAAANRDADVMAISGDGKQAAVELDLGANTPNAGPRRSGVVLRDITAGTTRSVARPPGTAPFVNEGGSSEDAGALSADGRFAVFHSDAAGLGTPQGARDAIFVRDRVTGAVTLVSRSDGADGAPFTGDVFQPAISADGRRVAFAGSPTPGVPAQVWVRDLGDATTLLASRADGADGAVANQTSTGPALDADGSRVAFASLATNLRDGDTDPEQDIHVRDLEAGTTTMVSRADGTAGQSADLSTFAAQIDAAGTRVAFITFARNLGDGDTDAQADVHLRDVSEGTTRLISAEPGGAKSNGETFGQVSIDAAGSRVAFSSDATNLAGQTSQDAKVFVRDLAAGSLLFLEKGTDPALSPDGGFVALEAGENDVRLHDIASGATQVVSRRGGPDGAPATADSRLGGISTGGGCVSFTSEDTLVGARRDTTDLYLRAVARDCGDAAVPTDGGAGDEGEGDGPATGDGPGAGEQDTVAPVLSAVRLVRRRFRARRGTHLRFRASEAGTLTVAVERVRPRRRGRRVVTRPRTLARAITAGDGRLRLRRVGGRRLRAGRYRLTVVARDAAGNRSRPVRLRFRVVA